MPEPSTFGRRQPASSSFGRAPLARAPDRAAAPGDALSSEAEAFRAQLASERRPAASGFAQWRGSQGGRRALVWAATLASFAPGVVTFVMDAPIEVSIGLEGVAIAGNIWLRRERRRRLREIVAWEDPADAS